MGLFSFAKNNGNKTVLLLDVGSASVGGAIISLNKDGKAHILKTVRKPMVLQEKLNFQRFSDSMLESLDNVLEELEKKIPVKPKSAVCVLSSPWHVSQTRTISIQEENSVSVTDKYLNSIVKKDLKDFEKTYKKESTDRDKAEKDFFEVLEAETVRVRLNGYEVANPRGVRAKNIEAVVFASLGHRGVIESIESHTRKTFNVHDFSYNSFALAGFSTIRDMFPMQEDFLFMDITGEVTDVVFVKDNIPMRTVSFPAGKNFIIRRIASELGTVPEEAISLFELYRKDKIEEKERGKLERILLTAENDWISSLTESLQGLSEVALPRNLYFTSDSELSGWLIETLAKAGFEGLNMSDIRFDVQFLGDELVEPFVSFANGVRRDSFLALEAIFIEKIKV